MPELKVFVAVLFYLIFVSALFTAIINDKEGTQLQTSVTLGETDYTKSNIQDYTHNDTFFSENLISNGLIFSGTWTYNENVGIVLSGTPWWGIATLTINYLVPINHIYTVTYYINNSVHQPFSILPLYEGDDNRLDVYLDTEGYHFRAIRGLGLYAPEIIQNVYDSSLMTRDNFTLTTVIDKNTNTFKFYDNDILLITATNEDLWDFPDNDNQEKYYAGVQSNTLGFTLEKILTKISNVYIPESTDIGTFFTTFFSIMFWTVDETYLPLALNIIIVKFPLILVAIFGFMVIWRS